MANNYLRAFEYFKALAFGSFNACLCIACFIATYKTLGAVISLLIFGALWYLIHRFWATLMDHQLNFLRNQLTFELHQQALEAHQQALKAQAQANTELEESIKRVHCEAMSSVSCLEYRLRRSPDDK